MGSRIDFDDVRKQANYEAVRFRVEELMVSLGIDIEETPPEVYLSQMSDNSLVQLLDSIEGESALRLPEMEKVIFEEFVDMLKNLSVMKKVLASDNLTLALRKEIIQRLQSYTSKTRDMNTTSQQKKYFYRMSKRAEGILNALPMLTDIELHKASAPYEFLDKVTTLLSEEWYFHRFNFRRNKND